MAPHMHAPAVAAPSVKPPRQRPVVPIVPITPRVDLKEPRVVRDVKPRETQDAAGRRATQNEGTKSRRVPDAGHEAELSPPDMHGNAQMSQQESGRSTMMSPSTHLKYPNSTSGMFNATLSGRSFHD